MVLIIQKMYLKPSVYRLNINYYLLFYKSYIKLHLFL